MMELIPRIREVWKNRHKDVLDSAENMTAALQSIEKENPGEPLDHGVLDKAYQELAQRFDKTYGGFSGSPKFPTPHNFFFMLRYWKRTGHQEALNMVEKTLQEIRWGGIFDQVGFGFHRYSTDKEWLVPHFEKMLYDQALLAIAYVEAWQATGKPEYEQTAREILAYVLRDLAPPEGGFYSAEDADSEGEEGRFYVWMLDQVREALGAEDAALAAQVFNLVAQGNWVDQATRHRPGTNILHLRKPVAALAAGLKMAEPELRRRLEAIRQRLFAARERRVHPHKDDKVLTDWNGLMIAALALAARAFDEPSYAAAARRAADFTLRTLRRPDGRLLHRYRDGEAAIAANASDYAFLIWGLIELYETDFEVRDLQAALDLTRDLLAHFWDNQAGGFFFAADDAEDILVRQKESYDGAVPSANSVAMDDLLRLSRMTGDAALEEKAARIGRAFAAEVAQAPMAYTQWMVALDFALGPSYEVVIAGRPGADDTRAMLRALGTRFLPNAVVLLRSSDQAEPDIARLAGFTREQRPLDGKATAYVCRSRACNRPTTDVAAMLESLGAKPAK